MDLDSDRPGELRDLPVDLIGRTRSQLRQRFDQARLAALAASLETTGDAATGRLGKPPQLRQLVL